MAGPLIVSKALPLFRVGLRQLPGCPNGTRVLVRPLPIAAQSEGGIIAPDVAKQRQMAGVLMAVGDDAADKAYDRGHEIGDEVWYGRYAGLIEEWQHLATDGEPPRQRGGAVKCAHDGAWDPVSKGNGLGAEPDRRWAAIGRAPHDEVTMSACRTCGALKLSERVIIMDFEDIVLNVDLQARLESGAMRRVRGSTAEGGTRYYIERVSERADPFETKGAA